MVICDEAHRSQYGFKGRFDTKTGEIKYGLAKALRDALPQATFLAFTGTPISQDDRDTQAVFGHYISIYDIQQAVEDGATVPIYFESRLAKLALKQPLLPQVDEQVDDLFADEDDIPAAERAKSRWAALEALVGAEPRLKQVAADLIAHFEQRSRTQPGKAMVVAMSRDICARLYDAIVALRPDWHDDDPKKGAIKVVMTATAADAQHLQPHHTTKQQKKDLEKRFKDPADPLKIVIVRDMWLTGFDAPCLATMYVDKPMQGANLAQAIARVNRVFKDKPGGLVVDYIGIAPNSKMPWRPTRQRRARVLQRLIPLRRCGFSRRKSRLLVICFTQSIGAVLGHPKRRWHFCLTVWITSWNYQMASSAIATRCSQ